MTAHNSVLTFDRNDPLDPVVRNSYFKLYNCTGEGKEFTGWLNWPKKFFLSQDYSNLKKAGEEIRKKSDHVISVGIGGSYLGAKALIYSIYGENYNMIENPPKIHFLGEDLSPLNLSDVLLGLIGKDEDFSVIYISKSGGTLEPALAFRFCYNELLKKYGKEEADKRVYAVTDKNSGVLHDLAVEHNWQRFVIPDDIGGRYSVFTPCGLLPLLAVGMNTDVLLKGAIQAQDDCENSCKCISMRYANHRYKMFKKGYPVELLSTNDPYLLYFSEWWKQLFGESEGKDYSGTLPVSVTYPTDLHSLGQYIQSGKRGVLTETQFSRKFDIGESMAIPDVDLNDNLNSLVGKSIDKINAAAMDGSFFAHTDLKNKQPVEGCRFFLNDSGLFGLGYTMYTMMHACAISAYAIGVNPFDQPGVEQHKHNTKEILGLE